MTANGVEGQNVTAENRRKWPRLGAWQARALGVLVAALAVGALLVLAEYVTRTTVSLDVDGQVRQVRTRAETVGAVLDEAGVQPGPADEVWPSPETALTDSVTITVRRAFTVAVRSDGTLRRVHTLAAHPLAVLAEQSIAVGENDRVRVDGVTYAPGELAGQQWSAPPVSVQVLRSVTLTVIDGARRLMVYTTEADVGRALDAAGLDLFLADRVTPDLSAPVADGLTVCIERSVPVTVVADGRRLLTRAHGPTVGDALAYVGLAPIGQDYTLPPPETPLEPGMVIQVVRVTEKVFREEHSIPFETIYQPDPALGLDEQRVIQSGTAGRVTRQVRVRYEDGREVSREVQEEQVTEPPTPRLIAYGKSWP